MFWETFKQRTSCFVSPPRSEESARKFCGRVLLAFRLSKLSLIFTLPFETQIRAPTRRFALSPSLFLAGFGVLFPITTIFQFQSAQYVHLSVSFLLLPILFPLPPSYCISPCSPGQLAVSTPAVPKSPSRPLPLPPILPSPPSFFCPPRPSSHFGFLTPKGGVLDKCVPLFYAKSCLRPSSSLSPLFCSPSRIPLSQGSWKSNAQPATSLLG